MAKLRVSDPAETKGHPDRIAALVLLRCHSDWRVGFFGQNISLAISPDQQQKSLCLAGRTNRFQTGGSIQFLRREVFGFFGGTSSLVSGAARLNGTVSY